MCASCGQRLIWLAASLCDCASIARCLFANLCACSAVSDASGRVAREEKKKRKQTEEKKSRSKKRISSPLLVAQPFNHSSDALSGRRGRITEATARPCAEWLSAQRAASVWAVNESESSPHDASRATLAAAAAAAPCTRSSARSPALQRPSTLTISDHAFNCCGTLSDPIPTLGHLQPWHPAAAAVAAAA